MIHQTDFDLNLISLTFTHTGSALGPALGQWAALHTRSAEVGNHLCCQRVSMLPHGHHRHMKIGMVRRRQGWGMGCRACPLNW